MSNFVSRWLEISRRKKTLLCVGYDPVEVDQRDLGRCRNAADKVEWGLEIIQATAPFAAAFKINRNYVKDLSRTDMQKLTLTAHQNDLLVIDDSKLADIGDTNDAGFYHAAREGFDAITVAPFPGNLVATCGDAKKRDIAVIALTLMSNPEFASVKTATLNNKPAYLAYAEQARIAGAGGIVVGAPSEKNSITENELRSIRDVIGDKTLALVPGIGAQGGDGKLIVSIFGDLAMINVGRAIFADNNPGERAREHRDAFNAFRR